MRDDLFIQRELYFGLPWNFTHRLKLDIIRERGFDYRDVGLWYAAMHDLANQSRVFGQFNTTVRRFIRQCGGEPVRTSAGDAASARLWRAFQAVELVNLDGDPEALDEDLLPATFTVIVLDAFEFNAPRAARKIPLSNAERQARYRARKKSGRAVTEESSEDAGEVTESNARVTSNAQTYIHTDVTSPEPSAGARAREGSESLTDAQVSAEVRRCRRSIKGTAGSVFVNEVLPLWEDRQRKRNRPAGEREALRELWRPVDLMVREFGLEVVSSALREAVNAGAPHRNYIESCCVTATEKEVAKSKPRRRGAKQEVGDVDWSEYDRAMPTIEHDWTESEGPVAGTAVAG
jgi:hypothetical protein